MNLSFENHCVNSSPSKIDQWSKPRPAAKLVLLLARRSPLMLKERAGGSMRTAIAVYDIDYQLILHNHTPPPCGHLLYLRGGVFMRFRILNFLFLITHYNIVTIEATQCRPRRPRWRCHACRCGCRSRAILSRVSHHPSR